MKIPLSLAIHGVPLFPQTGVRIRESDFRMLNHSLEERITLKEHKMLRKAFLKPERIGE